MVWPAVIAAGAAIAGSAIAANRQKKAAETAWDKEEKFALQNWARQQEQYAKRYQTTVEDMKKAGINPILAAQGGFGVGGNIEPQMPRYPMVANNEPQFGSTARDYAMAELSQQQTKTEKEKIQLLKNQVKETIARTYVERARKGLITQQERESAQRVSKMHAEIEKMSNEILVMKERGENIQKETKMLVKRMQVIDLEMKKLRQSANVYSTSYGQWMQYLKAFTEAIGINVGAITSFSRISK